MSIHFPPIAVLVPVLDRPKNVQPLIDSFVRATRPSDAALYFVVQEDDKRELAAVLEANLYERNCIREIMCEKTCRSWAKKINFAADYLLEAAKHQWFLLGADDIHFHIGWVDSVRKALKEGYCVIGTNDLGNPLTASGTRSTHPLVASWYTRVRGTVDDTGTIVHDGYHHNFPDTELVATARMRGLYLHEPACIIEHKHPSWGKSEEDEVYKLGASRFEEDKKLFIERAHKFGFDKWVDKPYVAPKDMPTITLAMIVKDAAPYLPATVKKALEAGCARIVIGVDTTSTDNTAAVALRLGCAVVPIVWTDDFAAARNTVLTEVECGGDLSRPNRWVLWMDKDETMPDDTAAALVDLCTGDHDVVCLRSPNFSPVNFAAKRGDEGWFLWPRLFRLGKGLIWTRRIHETIMPSIVEKKAVLRKTNFGLDHPHGTHSEEKNAYYSKLLRLCLNDDPNDAESAGYLAFEMVERGDVEGVKDHLAKYSHLIHKDMRMLASARWADLPFEERIRGLTDLDVKKAVLDVYRMRAESGAKGPLLVSVGGGTCPAIEPGLRLNLGCSDHVIPGFVNVDIAEGPGVVVADLTKDWPWADSSVQYILAADIIEHLPNKLHTMNEMWRVLEPGGRTEIIVPTTDGAGAFSDPTHVSYWNRRSFLYYTDGSPYRERFAKAYGITARFKVVDEGVQETEDGPKLGILLEAVKG